jgi:hypothetical protein
MSDQLYPIDFPAIDTLVNIPAPSTVFGVSLYCLSRNGYLYASLKVSSGEVRPLQPSFAELSIGLWRTAPNSTTVQALNFPVGTATGTATARTIATTSLLASLSKIGYVSAATAAALAGWRSGVNQFWLSTNQVRGGFYVKIQFAVTVVSTDSRWFAGLSASTAAPTNVEPNTINNIIGVGKVAGLANLQLITKGTGAATTVDLGANFPAATANTLYEIAVKNDQKNAAVDISITRKDVAFTQFFSFYTSTIPAIDIPMGIQVWICNNATAAANSLDLASIYTETI